MKMADGPSTEHGVPSEPKGYKGLIERAVRQGLIGSPVAFALPGFKAVTESESVFDQDVYIERKDADKGVKLNLRVPSYNNTAVQGRLFATTLTRTVDLGGGEKAEIEELFVFPALINENGGVDITFPPIAKDQSTTTGKIRLPLKPVDIDFLSDPLMKSVIKKSRIELKRSKNIVQAWDKFVEVHAGQLPSDIIDALAETNNL